MRNNKSTHPVSLREILFTMNLLNRFNKSLRFLDLGRTEQAIEILETLILDAAAQADQRCFIQASCVLGEVFFAQGKYDEAKPHLLNVANVSFEDDLLDYEKTKAASLLRDNSFKI
jgi:tetratricopeptide (TPR) repeat protein